MQKDMSPQRNPLLYTMFFPYTLYKYSRNARPGQMHGQSAKPSNIERDNGNDENDCQVGEEKCKPGEQFEKGKR